MISVLSLNRYGCPRPDFLRRCLPKGFNPLAPQYDQLDPIPVCTGDKYSVLEGRRSFPSGHSSYTFSVYGFIALYFYHYLLAPFSTYIGGWRLFSFFISLIPSLYCAISRTSDYRHHPLDVVVGSLLGFFVSYTCYWFYYPFGLSSSMERKLPIVDSAQLSTGDRIGHPYDNVSYITCDGIHQYKNKVQQF